MAFRQVIDGASDDGSSCSRHLNRHEWETSDFLPMNGIGFDANPTVCELLHMDVDPISEELANGWNKFRPRDVLICSKSNE